MRYKFISLVLMASIATTASVISAQEVNLAKQPSPHRVRFASFNTALNREKAGLLVVEVKDGGADVFGYPASVGTLSAPIGSIAKANLVVSSSNVTKPYDGNTSAAGTASVLTGTVFGGDSLSGGSFAFTDRNVGTSKTITVSSNGRARSAQASASCASRS